MASKESNVEIIQTLARIRTLINKGHRLCEIAKLTGWGKQRIWKVKEGIIHQNTSLSLNELNMMKPRKPGIMCRKCGEQARIFVPSGICVQCQLIEMSKLGIVTILNHQETQ